MLATCPLLPQKAFVVAKQRDDLVLVTGANGFVGSGVVQALENAGFKVRRAVRRPASGDVEIGDIARSPDWARALQGVRSVVHCAAIAHQAAPSHLASVNLDAAVRLAEAAERAGIERFVFVSSVKAASAATKGVALREDMKPAPDCAYGRAKLEAERAILAIGEIRPIALRPPLVHGRAAKANLARLFAFAASPYPAPVGGASNRRSLIALTTLADAVVRVIERCDGPSGAFFVADAGAPSIEAVVRAIRRGFGRRPNVWPTFGVDHVLSNIGPFGQVFGSLHVDDAKFATTYGYPVRRDALDAIAESARAWSSRQ